MRPRLRKTALIAHVTFSVGWIGAIVGFLALAVAGVLGSDEPRVRAMYLAMETVGWFVIVPLSVASLLSGVIQALGTEWGVFRHYWVVIKLVINLLATAVLLLHMQPVGRLAGAAASGPLIDAGLGGLQIQMIVDAGAAILVLLVATALSVWKPRGVTRRGYKHARRVAGPAGPGAPARV